MRNMIILIVLILGLYLYHQDRERIAIINAIPVCGNYNQLWNGYNPYIYSDVKACYIRFSIMHSLRQYSL